LRKDRGQLIIRLDRGRAIHPLRSDQQAQRIRRYFSAVA
jgi:hypothetical protein